MRDAEPGHRAHCDEGGLLVNGHRVVPADPSDLFKHGLARPVGCNRLVCGNCGKPVRQSTSFFLKKEALQRLPEVYDSPDWSQLDELRGDWWTPAFRFYACRCACWTETSDSRALRDPTLHADEVLPPWGCAGHPQANLPVTMDGFTFDEEADVARVVRDALLGRLPAAAATPADLDALSGRVLTRFGAHAERIARDGRGWEWLYRVCVRLYGTPVDGQVFEELARECLFVDLPQDEWGWAWLHRLYVRLHGPDADRAVPGLQVRRGALDNETWTRLASSQMQERLSLVVADALTDAEPEVRRRAIGFFRDFPGVPGSGRLAEVACADRSVFRGATGACGTQEDDMMLALAAQVDVRDERLQVVDSLALECLRTEMLRPPGPAMDAVFAAFAYTDGEWLGQHAEEIASVRPGEAIPLLESLIFSRSGAYPRIAERFARMPGIDLNALLKCLKFHADPEVVRRVEGQLRA